MNFNQVKQITIPEGEVVKIERNEIVLWEKLFLTALVSNGNQVIDTGVYCSDTMSCEIKIAWDEFPSNATYIGAIEYIDGAYRRCHFQAAKSGSNQVIGFWQDSPTMGNVVSVPFDTEPHILTYSAVDMTAGIDGVTATHGNTPTPSNSTFYLFDRNVVGFTANAEPGHCRLYYAKFWDNGILIRNFIPKEHPNGTIALYDMVNDEYYFDLNNQGFDYI